MESILQSIKTLLGASRCQDFYDDAILMQINSAISTIAQLDVDIPMGFVVQDDSATWNELSSDVKVQAHLRSYIYLFVKMAFDPPVSSAVLQSMEKQLREVEWRLNETNIIERERYINCKEEE